jgi:hypothetical protein
MDAFCHMVVEKYDGRQGRARDRPTSTFVELEWGAGALR